ncbi:serine/threonine protein kinase [Actinopolyspora erythraea]|uniref:Serine/threonine protein kinase n=1 Tax=Actinopolyspora erythraea TaxID=414996 RepID=A0A099D6A3_9ACTN|nr:serine/threonine-protein kinase [Actinopolyspora erythraea]ASU79471.1 serine/threonine protein kinase [Actinopolyspora erythraea]KGI80900.1 serine/threonine protein kinase [Actinopolyspora erythraea]
MQPLLSSEPSKVGDYRLFARIGKGAMGAVYLGCSRGGRPVAVKVAKPELAEDAEFRERFRREASMSASVGGFWTATVVDSDPEAEHPWLATEYVPGPTLHQAVTEHGPFPEHTVRRLGAGLAEALQAVHRAGLVHRDLKPSNVLLGPDGPRVIDFGISRAMAATGMTATGMFFGTPGFFSPEQTTGGEIAPPSDVFSLGAVLVFASAGTAPFGNENSAAMLYRVVHAEPDLGAVPEGLRPLIASCLAKDPHARPSTGELLDHLGHSGSPDGEWLPRRVTALISAHTAELDRVFRGDLPSTSGGAKGTRAAEPPGDSPVPRDNGNQERRGSVAVGATPVAAPEGTAVAPASRPSEAGRSDPRPNGGSHVAAPPPAQAERPLVRPDLPGPTFHSGRRINALLWSAFSGLLAYSTVVVAAKTGAGGSARVLLALGVFLLVLSSVLCLGQALTPGVRVRVNSDGLRISRMGLHREIPWSRVSRVGLVGSGKKQALTVWVHREFTPHPKWWHRTREYYGGSKIFSVGATGGWWRRRREARRLRAALRQYAPRSYDPRLL